jgi:hypothetical protein
VNLKTDEGRAMSTEATLTHHLQALYEGVEAVLSDYTEESVLFTPDGPVRGLAGIRAFFENFINNSPAELFQAVTLVRQDIVGEAPTSSGKRSHTSPSLPTPLSSGTARLCSKRTRLSSRAG